jgi:hypothetical protein
MRGDHGQGTIEYLAVVLVLAAVLAAAAAAATASGLGRQVLREFRRALCVVTGEACDAAARLAARPCVVASDRHTEGGRLTIMFLSVGSRNVVLREERSNGTVALTLVDGGSIGLDFSTGIGAHVRWGTWAQAVGTELRAAVLAGSESGKTWVARNAQHAAHLFERIQFVERYPRARSRLPIPDPRVTYSERSTDLSLDFHVGGRRAISLSTESAYGERVDHRTGRRTVYVRDQLGAGGKISYGGWSAEAEGAGEDRIGVTYDRHGRPVDLMVLSTIDLEGTAGLPPKLSRIAGYLRIPLHGSKHLETEQHLDLTDPFNAEVAQSYLGAFGDGRLGIAIAAKALRERLDERGTIRVRTYATESTGHEVGAHAKIGGVGIGGEVGTEDETAQLVSAVARGSDGRWGQDTACLAA